MLGLKCPTRGEGWERIWDRLEVSGGKGFGGGREITVGLKCWWRGGGICLK